MTAVNFNDHFRDRMGEMDRGNIEVFPKLLNLRLYGRTNSEIARTPRIIVPCQNVSKVTEDWGDYKNLPEEILDFS